MPNLSVIGREFANTGHTDTFKNDKSGILGLKKAIIKDTHSWHSYCFNLQHGYTKKKFKT